jgi:transketolase
MLRPGILRLLEIKDSDMRLGMLDQARDAVDNGIHAGGAFSATIPLVALYYGGFIRANVEQPTALGQDMFVLSKGHAVAALASIYADLGYFDRSVLKNSRSYASILNGHPGPVLPGAHIATGPMGQGLGVAQGFAIAGQDNPRFDVYAMTGDGELQEGPIWETVMFAGFKKLDNLCALIDHNGGQLDIHDRLLFPYSNLAAAFAGFGWKAVWVDATKYDAVYAALEEFKHGVRDGRPTAIICHSTKGHGSGSSFVNKHKVTMDSGIVAQETAWQSERRARRVQDFVQYFSTVSDETVRDQLAALARGMNLALKLDAKKTVVAVDAAPVPAVRTRRAPPRDKRVSFDPARLPAIKKGQSYATADIVTAAMKEFTRSGKIASIDSDLSSTSGLFAGVGAVDQNRALNAGVAEANMMLLGEAFAALGNNTWVSTFCPFFDWKVLRRIAVGHQERLEAIAAKDGWLSEGHGLDLTFLATASNFETQTNGATHMGNDDANLFSAIAQLKIIDCSCPRQLLAIIRWIMEGNRGLVYLRVLRAAAPAIHEDNYTFEFGRGTWLARNASDRATIVSAGRGVHEALAAAKTLGTEGISVGVVDLPSFDEKLLLELHDAGRPILFAEQNNGYLWDQFRQAVVKARPTLQTGHLHSINTRDDAGQLQFIHSGTYGELTDHFNLSPTKLAARIGQMLR